MAGDTESQGPPPEAKDQHYRYYASGKRIDVTLDDDLLAIDQDLASKAEVSAVERKRLREASRPLRGNLVLVPTSSISPLTQKALKSVGAVQRVFRADDATLVVLPEVRVEDSSQDRRKALRRWLAKHSDFAQVLNDEGEQLVLRPVSGEGTDALRLAATLSEEIHITSAQPRFMRIVRRPSKVR